MAKPVNPEKLVKIEMIIRPEEYKPKEGLFDLKVIRGTDIITEVYDILTIHKKLEELCPGKRSDLILDRLFNFGKLYINIETGEITT
jgi:hypothetical protein